MSSRLKKDHKVQGTFFEAHAVSALVSLFIAFKFTTGIVELFWRGRKMTKFDILAFSLSLFAISQSHTFIRSLLSVASS